MKTFTFETTLTQAELEDNLKKILVNDISLNASLLKYLFGDITVGFKLDGYVMNGNIKLVTHMNGYRKTMEIIGRIDDLGSIRKVDYKVSFLRTVEAMFFSLIMIVVFATMIRLLGNVPLFYILPITSLLIFLIGKLLIRLDNNITMMTGQKIFKLLMTGELE